MTTPTSDRRSRSVRANDAWEGLLTAHAALMRQFAEQDIWQDVSMREYDVLYTLSKSPDPQRLGDLGRMVLLSQPALSRLVDRLVSRGLVTRLPDPADARASNILLTDAGRELQRRVGLAHGVAVARAVTSRLTEQEIAQLEYLTHKLVEESP